MLPTVFVATVFNGYSNHRSMNTVVLLKINQEILFDILDALEGVIDYAKVGVRILRCTMLRE
jgi:N-ethylmaleimide reductase